nr:MAG TPA: hypothetical protein [Caudoviricetes sp.]
MISLNGFPFNFSTVVPSITVEVVSSGSSV